VLAIPVLHVTRCLEVVLQPVRCSITIHATESVAYNVREQKQPYKVPVDLQVSC